MAPLKGNITGFAQAFRKAGLRLTHQRLEIYRELTEATDHPTAEMLHRRLRERIPTLSLDTVYRTLATLAAHGMLKRVETAESLARFDATKHRHHHIICKQCNEIMDFQWQQLDKTPLPEEIGSWGLFDNMNVVVYGICGHCLKKTDATT
jgi:Fur family transcriptional regulator, peroxide stress response regulator